MTPDQFLTLQKIIKIQFKNQVLLQTAFTHKSYAKRHRNKIIEDNERLEFFGDAVLKLIVSEYLFKENPLKSEGCLSKIRAALISDRRLATFAQALDFGSYIKLSFGESKTNGHEKESVLAATFEAFLGALYLDQGLSKTTLFLLPFLQEHASTTLSQSDYKNHKAYLQEHLQKQRKATPIYKIEKTTGPDHEKRFEVSVSFEDNSTSFYLKGNGLSRKEAEQDAAKKAWLILTTKESATYTPE